MEVKISSRGLPDSVRVTTSRLFISVLVYRCYNERNALLVVGLYGYLYRYPRMDGRMMYPQVNAVIALLNSSEIRFDMEDPEICIGGHCRTNLNQPMLVEEAFRLVSGIDDNIISDLVCFPKIAGPYEATVAQAINMLEYLRDYGIVDWAKALGEAHA